MRPITADVPRAWSICVSVCLLVTTVRLGKTAEPIMMPFVMRTHTGATWWPWLSDRCTEAMQDVAIIAVAICFLIMSYAKVMLLL